jgi:hypothetical protein
MSGVKASRAARKPPPVVAVPAEDLAELREGNRRAADARHSASDREQVRLAIEATVERAVGRLATSLSSSSAAPASGRLTDVPVWLKVLGALTAASLGGLGILALVWNFAIAPVNVRLASLEVAKAEGTVLLGRLENRQRDTDAKVAELTTQINTATRIRDQQQQGTTDRIRGLEQSDQAGAQQINALATSLAGLVARMEEMLRRQERLENRLSSPGPRQGMDEAPAVFAPSPRHTAG